MSTRREVLGFMGGITASCLWGCTREQSASSQPIHQPVQLASSPGMVPTCIVRPEQTTGPFFLNERLNRSDLRSNPGDGRIKAGVPLQLVFQVAQVSDRRCTPLQDAIVDVWHCDAEGIYSGVNDSRVSTVGQQFLRGYQVTNAEGLAQFVTIYPGWYPGRAVHIHFMIRRHARSQAAEQFASQLYFDDALTDRIHAQSPYPATERRTRNQQDGLFQWGGNQLLLALSESAAGYRGIFSIGLELA